MTAAPVGDVAPLAVADLAAVKWLRGLYPSTTAVVTALPVGYDPGPAGPAIVVQLISGDQAESTPDGDAWLQFDVWGGTKATAALLALDLAAKLHALSHIRVAVDLDETAVGVHLAGAHGLSSDWRPDVKSDPPRARYVVEAFVTLGPTAVPA